MSEGYVKLLYEMPVIDGKKVMVFQCGRPSVNEYGDANIAALKIDASMNGDVYYEANDMTVQWFKSPFYIGRTAPTHGELAFQLRKWHNERQMKFSIAAVISVIVLYLLFK